MKVFLNSFHLMPQTAVWVKCLPLNTLHCNNCFTCLLLVHLRQGQKNWELRPRGELLCVPSSFEWVLSQLCLTLCNPMDFSQWGSSAHMGLTWHYCYMWVAISSSSGSSGPRGRTYISFISCVGRQILYCWATEETVYFILNINYV